MQGRNRLRNNRGQAIVELAILLPVLLLIIMGTLEFGRIFNSYMIISHASRDGARTGSVGGSNAAVVTAVENATPTLNDSNMTITITPSDGSRDRGESITVRINYNVDLVVPLIGNIVGDPVQLEAETTMRIE